MKLVLALESAILEVSDSNHEVFVDQEVKSYVHKSEILDSTFCCQLRRDVKCYQREKAC